MNIEGKPYRSIWLHPQKDTVFQIIDQRYLPHRFVVEDIGTSKEGGIAIKEMWVRGAPLIGAAAAYSMYLATLEASKSDDFEAYMEAASKMLLATRPTAINLQWAIQRQQKAIAAVENIEEKVAIALQTAKEVCEEDVVISENIGKHGLELIEAISQKKSGGVGKILTHCNTGWLATADRREEIADAQIIIGTHA
ncbi:MAG: hypothetical protein AB8B69_18355, partial [Chitinophagales bacterium]